MNTAVHDLAIILTLLLPDLAAAAIWDGIVAAARRVCRVRRSGESTIAGGDQYCRLTFVSATETGYRIVETEAIGENVAEDGFAAAEKIFRVMFDEPPCQ